MTVLSSGSSGNAAYVEPDEGRGVLVDAGVSCRSLVKLLGLVGLGLGDLGAVLLTHGHGDHTSGVRRLVKECGVEVYSAPGVGEEFGANIIEPGLALPLGDLEAIFFEVPHDTPTYGLRISNDTTCAAIATDLGEVTESVMRWLRGAEALVLEANHDEQWLWGGPYPRELKRRVASPVGHLSNARAAETALGMVPHGLKDLVLAHLSERNNSPVRACGAARNVLRKAGHDDIRIRAAIAGHPTPWVEVGMPLATREYVYRYATGGGADLGVVGQLFEVE